MGPLSEHLAERLRSAADPAGRLTFARFMEIALYDARAGYYRRNRPRVGTQPGTDFFTAASAGPLFGQLVAAACRTLLPGEELGQFTFVEIGAESEGGILEGVAHPFGAVRVLRLGDPLTLRGPCILFSNELFDAQPFHRFRFRGGRWREWGVQLLPGRDPLRLAEVELSSLTPAPLPAGSSEGYTLDLPLAAAALAQHLAAEPWTGLFLAFDYGKSWASLTHEFPEGTARAYTKHRQSNALLDQPGEQDLTCHICWDWVDAALKDHGFIAPTLESQEAFFTHHAGSFIAATIAQQAKHLSPNKLALLQLLHPAHLGQKFQVLHALRPNLPLLPGNANR